MSKISIIIPVFNAEKNLHNCIESIINQTFQDWELLLVDDGSTDRSGKICDDYANNDNRFFVIHKQNEGVTKARIDGLQNATSKFIMFIDADDYLSLDACSILIKYMEEYGTDIIIGGYYDVYGEKKIINKRKYNGVLNKNDIINILKKNFLYDVSQRKSGIPVFLWGKLYKKEVLENVLEAGLNTWYAEDLLSSIYLFNHIESAYITEIPIYYYVHHHQQTTLKNPIELCSQCNIVWEKIYQIDTKNYFSYQLPYKIWTFNNRNQNRAVKELSFKDFKILERIILQPFVSQKLVYHSKVFKVHGKKNKLHLFFLRHNMYLFDYLLLRIK